MYVSQMSASINIREIITHTLRSVLLIYTPVAKTITVQKTIENSAPDGQKENVHNVMGLFCFSEHLHQRGEIVDGRGRTVSDWRM